MDQTYGEHYLHLVIPFEGKVLYQNLLERSDTYQIPVTEEHKATLRAIFANIGTL